MVSKTSVLRGVAARVLLLHVSALTLSVLCLGQPIESFTLPAAWGQWPEFGAEDLRAARLSFGRYSCDDAPCRGV